MKSRHLLIAILLIAMVPAFALATDFPDAVAVSDSTNGLSRMMTVSDYVDAYNNVLIATVPPGEGLLDAPDEKYIAAAEMILFASDPNLSLATIHDAQIYRGDPYGRICVWFDVSESVAFGTSTRGSYYVFLQALRADDTFAYLDGAAVLSGDDPAQIQQYLATNEFFVNPAEKAVRAYLQSADAYTQVESVRLSPDEVYAPYVYAGRGYSMTLYTGPAEGQLAGIQLSIGEEQLGSFPMAERSAFINRCLASAIAAMQGDAGTESALAIIRQLFDTTRLTPSGDAVYENDMLYGCFAENGMITFVAMPVQASIYAEQAYWWVNQSMPYLIAQADSALRAMAYDSAIWYYEEAGFTTSTSTELARAYYEKAAGYLDAKRYDQAIATFEQAEPYGDSAARIAEAYYRKGDAEYDAGDTLLAMRSFANAGNYEDAKQRVLSCAYWLGEDALAARDYDGAEAYFEQASGYLDADMKIKQVHYERAEQLMQVGNEAEAVAYYQRASGYLDAEDKAGAEYYRKGEAAMANRDYVTAAQYFAQAGNYLDSREKLAQIADIDNQQAYEQAVRQCAPYFDNPVDTPFPQDAYAALEGMSGYGDSAQLMLKLEEVRRILDVLGQIGTPHRGGRIRDYFGIKEVSQDTGRVALEFTSWFIFKSYDAGFILEASPDRSTYSVSSWAQNNNFTMYGNDDALDLLYRFTAMITGNTKTDGALQQMIHDVRWEWVGDKITTTIFTDGYTLDFTLLPGDRGSFQDFSIVATKNAY